MLVAQILKTKGDKVFTASPDDTLEASAALLFTRRVGAMVVVDARDDLVGIFSERDLVRAVAEEGAAALSKPVSAFMTRDVIFAHPHESVEELLERMTDRRIRHLPVVETGRLRGIISIGDLVKAKIAAAEAEAKDLKAYIAAG